MKGVDLNPGLPYALKPPGSAVVPKARPAGATGAAGAAAAGRVVGLVVCAGLVTDAGLLVAGALDLLKPPKPPPLLPKAVR